MKRITGSKIFIDGEFVLGGIEFDSKIRAAGPAVTGKPGPNAAKPSGPNAAKTAGLNAAKIAGPNAAEASGPNAAKIAGPNAAKTAGPNAAETAGPNAAEAAGKDAAKKADSDFPGFPDSGSECFYIIPGLIDIHTHAAMGKDASDGDAEGMEVMSRYYAKGGVTSWCPTTMTLKEETLTKAMRTIRDFKRPAHGARAVGVNLEGPFISSEKKGSQAAENLHLPDIGMFRRLSEASGGMVRLVTVAPEEPGGIEFIREASRSAAVSIGHTAADYETAMRAYEAGASHTTHLFNGMPPMHHRKPGVVGAAADSGATVELITDGIHIHPSVVRLAAKVFGERLVLISDSIRCAGMPDGDYTLGGQLFTMKEGRATLTGTDTLAGSSIHLTEGLRRCVSFGVSLERAVLASTYAPAKVIGMEGEIGSLSAGMRADIVVLDEALNVRAVFIDGEEITGSGIRCDC